MSKPFFYRIDVAALFDFATEPEGEGMTLLKFAKELQRGESDIPFIQQIIDEARNYIETKRKAGSKGGKAKSSTAKQCYSSALAKPSTPLASSSSSSSSSSSTESETKEKKKRFVPPSIEDVTAFCRERGNRVDPSRWLAYYESNGWRVGKNKMVNWKSAVITWENSDGRSGNPSSAGSTPQKKGGIIQPNGPDADWLGGA